MKKSKKGNKRCEDLPLLSFCSETKDKAKNMSLINDNLNSFNFIVLKKRIEDKKKSREKMLREKIINSILEEANELKW